MVRAPESSLKSTTLKGKALTPEWCCSHWTSRPCFFRICSATLASSAWEASSPNSGVSTVEPHAKRQVYTFVYRLMDMYIKTTSSHMYACLNELTYMCIIREHNMFEVI